jgi:glucokinase
VDVGGTKIQVSLIEESGAVLSRERTVTPREAEAEQSVAAVEGLIETVLAQAGITPSDLTAIGIAVPGVVDPDTGHVVRTPNMNLSGIDLGPRLEARFHVPVALGNDCNLGALGETWLGSARKAQSAIAILVGTGIGGGIVRKGKLWRGAREAAGEVGHMIMQVGGPKCGCGNRGCLEALAGRLAIENQLRAAVESGRQTALTEILQGDLSRIRSGALKQALEQQDPLVTEVVQHAAEVLGYACLTIRHLLDPEVILLGGGVIVACADYFLPVVEKIIDADQLPGARPGGRVLLSALGDDAVVLGAVALARMQVGRSPFKKRFAVAPNYPAIQGARVGEITVGQKTFDRDVYILVNGEVKKRKKKLAGAEDEAAHTVGPKELEGVCGGGPEILFVGSGENGAVKLSDEARRYLTQRSIEFTVLPTPEIVDVYNKSKQRKAALIHVTC